MTAVLRNRLLSLRFHHQMFHWADSCSCKSCKLGCPNPPLWIAEIAVHHFSLKFFDRNLWSGRQGYRAREVLCPLLVKLRRHLIVHVMPNYCCQNGLIAPICYWWRIWVRFWSNWLRPTWVLSRLLSTSRVRSSSREHWFTFGFPLDSTSVWRSFLNWEGLTRRQTCLWWIWRSLWARKSLFLGRICPAQSD